MIVSETVDDVSQTRNMRIAELHGQGTWDLVNVFSAGGSWYYKNNVLTPNFEEGGFCHGMMKGQPIFSCGLCGHNPIVHHYTVKNSVTKELLNVGSECINVMIGVKRSEAIMKGIESLRRKVDTDFKRVVYHKQLTEWLNENINQLDKLHNETVDLELKENPEKYWSEKTEIVFQYDERGENVMEVSNRELIPVRREIPVPEVRRKKDAGFYESRDRNFWKYMYNNFAHKDWNPKTMADSFRGAIKRFKTGQIEVPKMRKLTQEEKRIIAVKQQEFIDQFVAKMNIENEPTK